jgi:F0F1-type ATP synthase assembly protein I
MEYIVALLVIALIVVLYIKQPSKIYDVVIGSLVESLQNKEGEIVYGLYNKLPQAIKDKVDSKLLAEIVSFILDVVVDVLGKKDTK